MYKVDPLTIIGALINQISPSANIANNFYYNRTRWTELFKNSHYGNKYKRIFAARKEYLVNLSNEEETNASQF